MAKKPVILGTLEEIIFETPRVSTFIVKLPAEADFSFISGQFAMLSLPDFQNDKGRPVRRAYSIASSPHDLVGKTVSFTITRKGEGGYFSNRIHEAAVGDSVSVEGPYGSAFVLDRQDSRPHLFIAAGSGIAPLRSMIRTLLAEGSPPPIELLYGFRNDDDFIYARELSGYQSNRQNFSLLTAHSRPAAGWKGLSGRIPEVLPSLYGSYKGQVVYICGHPEMVTQTVEWLRSVGFPEEAVRKEQW